MTDEELNTLSDTDLVEFANNVLAIPIPYGTKRTTILTKIINAAVAIPDRMDSYGGGL